MITNEEIQKLRELMEKSTKAPWVFHHGRDGYDCSMRTDAENYIGGIRGGGWVLAEINKTWEEEDEATAEFIAKARNTMPQLLDEIERLKRFVASFDAFREGTIDETVLLTFRSLLDK